MSQTANDNPPVSAALRSSAVLAPVDRAVETLWHSAEQSRAVALTSGWMAQWRSTPSGERRLAMALVLWSAAASDVVLTMIAGMPPGWLWLVPPAAAVSIGLLLAAQARSVRA